MSLDTENWRRIDKLFNDALDLNPADRPRFLDEACEDSNERRRVEALLKANAVSRCILDQSTYAVAKSVGPPEEARGELKPGADIGPYRIEREIARGGMGVVYLASRADEAFERRVAIKVLGHGMASAGLEGRFRSERQILAALEHPNIARLYEGGTTVDGRPYLVMEYVDGLPLDRYCDLHCLPIHRRLALFRKICAAVSFAHERMVVHRDLKPSNILVDASGEPKLLDFGIAKLLDPEMFPMTVEATRTGQRPMTVGYASPEQVRGATITTASDVYSLGVILYELLSGHPPHRLDRLSPLDIERVLTENDPLKPSVACDQMFDRITDHPSRRSTRRASTPGEIGHRRGCTPSQLRCLLEGHLDNIALMALRREPGRRYGSVRQLSEDLSRYLSGLPVRARQASLAYRWRKSLERNKAAVVVTSLILAMIFGFSCAMAFQASQIMRHSHPAQQAWFEHRYSESHPSAHGQWFGGPYGGNAEGERLARRPVQLQERTLRSDGPRWAILDRSQTREVESEELAQRRVWQVARPAYRPAPAETSDGIPLTCALVTDDSTVTPIVEIRLRDRR